MNDLYLSRDADRKSLLLVELNEFDPNYLSAMAIKLNLGNLARALSCRHCRTSTADRLEHQGLDPWVQWVGVHSGMPAELHGVRRLGATRAQSFPQIWHEVAKRGYSWGVWGAMNAPLGDWERCCFFMPDPWSFEEIAYPADLNDLLALPRYAAKNYLKIDYLQAFAAALRLARFFAPPRHWELFARFGAKALRKTFTSGPNIHTFTTLIDYLGVLCFLKRRAQSRPDLSIIFLNHIAHLQHQFWLAGPELHPEMEFGLRLCDAMLGLLLRDRGADEAFLLMNGLKQKNVAGKGFYVYRQSDPQRAIEAIGVAGGRVEQCMTHDATILFSNRRDADSAFELLRSCRLSDGHDAFFVERQSEDRIFYQLAFEHDVQPDTAIICGNYSQPFYEVFQLVCERTGAHIPEGDIFCDDISVPQQIENHEVFNCVLSHFGGTDCRKASPLASGSVECAERNH